MLIIEGIQVVKSIQKKRYSLPEKQLFDCNNADKSVSLRYGNSAGKSLEKEDLLKVISSRDQALANRDEKIDLLTSERDVLSQERDYLKAQVEDT